MNYPNQDIRYTELARRQLRQDLDKMGYGYPAQVADDVQNESTSGSGFLVSFATIAVLFLGISLLSLVA